MSVWAVIPVKPLNRAKSRLAEVLSAEQRYLFALAMYQQVLRVASSVRQLSGVLVISRDTKALALAREQNARTIQETSSSELNPALTRATEMAKFLRASAVLILPADLPFITSEDVEKMVEMGRSEPCVVIATDRDKDGTNAMLVRPTGLFPYSYGDGSFVRHVASARGAGAAVQIYQSDTIALDIDVPADLHTYNQMVLSGKVQLPNLTPFLPDIIVD